MEIRPFNAHDFEPLSKIIGQTWYEDYGSRSYWLGGVELCVHLEGSDFGLTAVGDSGQLEGALLLGSPLDADHNPQMRSMWRQQRRELDVMARAFGMDSRAALVPVWREEALMGKVASLYGTEGVGVVRLVIVDEQARGQGIARALFREGIALLQEHGASELRLATSDNCDWQMYEAWGMRRILTDEDASGSDVNIYVFQGLPKLDDRDEPSAAACEKGPACEALQS